MCKLFHNRDIHINLMRFWYVNKQMRWRMWMQMHQRCSHHIGNPLGYTHTRNLNRAKGTNEWLAHAVSEKKNNPPNEWARQKTKAVRRERLNWHGEDRVPIEKQGLNKQHIVGEARVGFIILPLKWAWIVSDIETENLNIYTKMLKNPGAHASKLYYSIHITSNGTQKYQTTWWIGFQ